MPPTASIHHFNHPPSLVAAVGCISCWWQWQVAANDGSSGWQWWSSKWTKKPKKQHIWVGGFWKVLKIMHFFFFETFPKPPITATHWTHHLLPPIIATNHWCTPLKPLLWWVVSVIRKVKTLPDEAKTHSDFELLSGIPKTSFTIFWKIDYQVLVDLYCIGT